MNKDDRQSIYNDFRSKGWDQMDVAIMMDLNYHQQNQYEAHYKGATQ